MASGGNVVPRITEAEHIGPNDTGDNIEAKRVASYVWDGSNWQRAANEVTYTVSTGNSTDTPLTGGGVFTGSWDSTLGYEAIEVTLQSSHNSATNGAVIQYSNDGGTTITKSSQATVTGLGGLNDGYSFIINALASHFRILYTNGTSAQSKFHLYTKLHKRTPTVTQVPIGSTLTDLDSIQPVKAIIAGKNPDGVYVNAPTNGTLTLAPALSNLTAGGVYTSNWFSCDKFVGATFAITTDQVSATDGIEIDFGQDASTVKAMSLRTFTATDVTKGSKTFSIPIQGDYFRLKYTNGGSNQTAFSVHADLTITAMQTGTDTIEGTINAGSISSMGRDIVAAKDPTTATYENITRSTTASSITGLHVAVAKHEVATPILALTSWVTNQATISSATTPISVIPSPTSGRKTFIVKAISTNTKTVFIGPSNAVTAGNGFELAAGESMALELDNTASVWVIGTTAASQQLCYAEVVGV